MLTHFGRGHAAVSGGWEWSPGIPDEARPKISRERCRCVRHTLLRGVPGRVRSKLPADAQARVLSMTSSAMNPGESVFTAGCKACAEFSRNSANRDDELICRQETHCEGAGVASDSSCVESEQMKRVNVTSEPQTRRRSILLSRLDTLRATIAESTPCRPPQLCKERLLFCELRRSSAASAAAGRDAPARTKRNSWLRLVQPSLTTRGMYAQRARALVDLLKVRTDLAVWP